MRAQRKAFKVSKMTLAVATAIAAQGLTPAAFAGAGWGDSFDFNGAPIKVPTFYANSPSGVRKNANPNVAATTVDTGAPLRKFVDSLPGLTPAGANNLGQYLPVAVADAATYPGSDYYEIAVVEYQEKMHSDLPKATTLRGYVQIETPANAAVSKHIALTYPGGAAMLDAAGNQIYAVDNPHYLGPVIVATKGRAVRVKYSNLLPAGNATIDGNGKVVRNGDLFLPVDETLLGAGVDTNGNVNLKYSQNRAEIHLHGGDTPWISDGTPHQWVAPAADPTTLKKGVSYQNVPDMVDPGPGAGTLYWPNNQSARLMFYHDHTSGLTRLNVYGGEAAGYLITDSVEADLVSRGILPTDMVPLVIQDKTFVPKDIAEQDGRWDTAHWGDYGDLWFPHVYETNQDPNSVDGTNPVGRWDYGPWFWPVFPAPLPMPTGIYGDVSTTPEAFMDTPVVNGTAYPTMTVDPKAYRFRILTAGNDRMLNLGLYVADPSVTTSDGRKNTEVKMVPAVAPSVGSPLPACGANQAPPTCWPNYWPTDGRAEGVPDPAAVGPDIVVVGNEAGFLPGPDVIPSTPVGYEMNRRSVTVLNVLTHGVFMGPAERVDAVIDFSKYAGKTLILYNDSPAPVPAFDPRIDYFTGAGDQTGGGGVEDTKAGFGPNTRTIMQIKVSSAAPAPAFNVAALQAALPTAYGQSQNPPVVGESAYNAAFGTNYIDTYAKIRTGSGQQSDFIWTPTGTPQTLTSITVTDGGVGYIAAPDVVISGGGGSGAVAHAVLDPSLGRVASVVIDNAGTGFTSAPSVVFKAKASGGIGATASVHTSATMVRTVQSKAIQELFDPNYGRMNATLGVELPFTTALTQTTIPLGYVDPPTEYIGDGETQIWKITHNGVDTHPVHFHLMNVQLINRVGWDGTIKPPTASELGWKETIKMHPLEDIVIAISPKTPKVPFGVPESARYRDPSQVAGGTAGFTQVEFNQASPNFGLTVPAGTVNNQIEQYGWEYVWHCHILGHEENDFMRPLVFNFGALPPDAPTALAVTDAGVLTWTDATPAADPATMLSKKNEIGFRVERVTAPAAPAAAPAAGFAAIGATLANATTYTDASAVTGTSYWYRVVAYNAKGEAASTAVNMTATSAGPDAAPTLLVATAVSSTVVNLTWKDNSTNESGFVVQRCIADATGVCTGPQVTLTTTVANVQSYSDATAAANTTYVYQVFARNAAGDTTAVKSNVVTTLIAPANAPSNVQALASSDTQVTLSWTDNSSNESGFLVQRSADGGATWLDVLSTPALTPVPQTKGGSANITVAANIVGFVDTGLVQHTTYLYRVGSVTSGGVATSMPVTVTTNYAAAPVVGPVTGAALWNQVTLSWPAAAPVTSFTINRSGGAAAATFTAAAGATGFVDSSVIQNTPYSYTVTAINGPNAGTASAAANVTTPYAPAPAMPGLSASANSTTAVALSWLPPSATAYVTGLRVMRCVQSAANFNCTSPSSVFTQVYSFDGAALPTTWVDTGVLASTGYTYQAFFVNGTQNGVASTASVSIPASFAVAAPTALTATLNGTRISLTWTDGSTNETAFYVERSTDGINFSQVSTVAATTGTGSNRTFNDTAIAPGVVYMYRVKAVNVTGAMTTSSAYAGPVVVDMTIGAPNALTATPSTTQVALSWRDNSTNENAFVVYRSADGSTWAQAGTAAALVGNTGTQTFNDNALALIPGHTYSYYVTARWTFNAVNYESVQSAQVQAKIADLPAPTNLVATMNATAVALTWTDNAPNETRFWVDRSSDGGVTWSQAGAPAARNGTGNVNFTDTTVTAGNSYSYRVKAENVTGTVVTPSAWSNIISAHFAIPAAPATVTAAAGATAGAVVVSWTDSADNETGYTIQRRNAPTTATPNPAWGNGGTVGANVTTWTDTGRTSGRGYQYQVRANNSLGSSAWVASVPATVTAP